MLKLVIPFLGEMCLQCSKPCCWFVDKLVINLIISTSGRNGRLQYWFIYLFLCRKWGLVGGERQYNIVSLFVINIIFTLNLASIFLVLVSCFYVLYIRRKLCTFCTKETGEMGKLGVLHYDNLVQRFNTTLKKQDTKTYAYFTFTDLVILSPF